MPLGRLFWSINKSEMTMLKINIDFCDRLFYSVSRVKDKITEDRIENLLYILYRRGFFIFQKGYDKMAVLKIKVNFFDTDAMAVVHHANYFKWFEMARIEFLREAGITLNELMNDGIVFPITDVSCKYRASAHFDDIVRIETVPAELTKVKMSFNYKVYRDSDDKLLAEGFTQNLFTSLESGRIIKLPETYYRRLCAVK